MRKVLLILAISIVIFNLSYVIMEAQVESQAQQLIDSIMKELPKMKEDTSKVLQYLRLNDSYRILGDYEKSNEYANYALLLAKELKWKRGEANVYRNIGNNYVLQSNYSEALDNYHISLRINEEIDDKLRIAIALGDIGLLYLLSRNFEKSIEYYNRTLAIFKEFNVSRNLANIYGNISMSHYYLGNLLVSLEFATKSLDEAHKENNQREIGIAHNYLGTIYTDLSDYPKALENFEKGLRISEEVGDRRTKSICIGFMGRLHYILTQDSVRTRLKDQNHNIDMNRMNNFKKAIFYINQTVEIGKFIKDSFILTQCYEYLRLVYRDMGDFEKAYEYQEKWFNLKDSVYSLEKTKEIANLEAKRENELKDAEITILNTEKKAQQFQSYLLGGGVIVLFGAFGIAFLRFREKKKLSDKLAVQNTEIETQKSLVEEKNEQIVSSITYASTIQHAILPWDSTLQKAFTNILIFYKPKDIVSGDSYWFQEVDGIRFLAVIDCTGHGIPGAMLTVIASTALDDSVLGKRLSDTGQILTYMNEKVTEVLNQRLAENSIRDGMEVALIAIHQDKIQFSGAGRPLYIKNETMEIIKTDKRGIAGQTENDEYEFSSVDIEKTENLMLYLTTDGYADQMNEESKKYSTKRFVSLLDSISEKPISEQQELLENEFNNHKGQRSQIDDVTILGVKL